MKRVLVGLIGLGLAACQTPEPIETIVEVPVEVKAPPPASAIEALNTYYQTFPEEKLPQASIGAPLPASDQTLTRILVGSCNNEENESQTLATLAGETADLFLMVGDNVYGDMDGRTYSNNQPELDELRESFAELAANEDFKALRDKTPMMVAWDDHDYGMNDAGGAFAFKGLAERIHEHFWRLSGEDVGRWPGTYYARSFGPEGQRTQIIMLDTRYFRSPLTPTDEWGAAGKERYVPAPEGSPQDMLGAAQWTWLENQLAEPADLRLIVSSIQVLPTVHGWESWSALPAERQQLFDLIDHADAKGVIFVSGDRHTSFLYEAQDILPYPTAEITASSMNASFAETSEESDPLQIGAGYPPENFGAIGIDWQAGEVELSIHDNQGETVRRTRAKFR